MANHDELGALMISGLDGEAVAYRTLLDRLSLSLRVHYKGKLVRAGRAVAEGLLKRKCVRNERRNALTKHVTVFSGPNDRTPQSS